MAPEPWKVALSLGAKPAAYAAARLPELLLPMVPDCGWSPLRECAEGSTGMNLANLYVNLRRLLPAAIPLLLVAKSVAMDLGTLRHAPRRFVHPTRWQRNDACGPLPSKNSGLPMRPSISLPVSHLTDER